MIEILVDISLIACGILCVCDMWDMIRERKREMKEQQQNGVRMIVKEIGDDCLPNEKMCGNCKRPMIRTGMPQAASKHTRRETNLGVCSECRDKCTTE